MKRIKKVSRFDISYKTVAIIFVSALMGIMVQVSLVWFFDNYRLQSPFQSPIVPRDMSPIPDKSPVIVPPKEKPIPTTTPKPRTQTKAQIVASSKYPDFIDHLWERESTRGQNVEGLHAFCLQQGLSNEMGFYPSGKHCFPTFEASVRRLERWYEEHPKLSENQKKCFYNKGYEDDGSISDSCAYLSYRFSEMN